MERTVPTMISVAKFRPRPLRMSAPYPPWPMRLVTVTSPTTVTAAMRIPAMITGMASGTWIFQNRYRGV
jgi:hypothetical protein